MGRERTCPQIRSPRKDHPNFNKREGEKGGAGWALLNRNEENTAGLHAIFECQRELPWHRVRVLSGFKIR